MGVFHFRQFDIDDHGCGMKICSDSVTFGAWFLPCCHGAHSVLDIGAGSGLLSIMAAQCMPAAVVRGLEIDSSAAEAAALNFRNTPWAERLSAIHCDFSAYEPERKPDVILSNPPFFTNGLLAADTRRATARHEDTLTAASLMAYARKNLADSGHLGLILPADRIDDTIFEAELAGLKLRRLCRVIPREGKAPVRALFDFSPTDGPVAEEDLTIRNSGGSPTESYISLVEPFYIKIS